jgi:hypothetical protein
MAKRDDELTQAQQGGERGDRSGPRGAGDRVRDSGIGDVRGIAGDEGDLDEDFEEDDLEEMEEDEEEGL